MILRWVLPRGFGGNGGDGSGGISCSSTSRAWSDCRGWRRCCLVLWLWLLLDCDYLQLLLVARNDKTTNSMMVQARHVDGMALAVGSWNVTLCSIIRQYANTAPNNNDPDDDHDIPQLPLHFFFPPKQQRRRILSQPPPLQQPKRNRQTTAETTTTTASSSVNVHNLAMEYEALGYNRNNPLFSGMGLFNPFRRRRLRRRPIRDYRLDCSLSLFPDGTFTMVPNLPPTASQANLVRPSQRKEREKTSLEEEKQQEEEKPTRIARWNKRSRKRPQNNNNYEDDEGWSHSQLLTMNGRWRLFPNPYCATDRFHDVIQFQSFPRKALIHSNRPRSRRRNYRWQKMDKRKDMQRIQDDYDDLEQDGMVLQRQSFIWQSRLLGHYTRQYNQPRLAPFGPPGRMVRGICLLKQEAKPQHYNTNHQKNDKDNNNMDRAPPQVPPRRRWSKRRQQRERIAHELERKRQQRVEQPKRVVAQFTAQKWKNYPPYGNLEEDDDDH